METYPTIELSDGRPMPQLGFGVWQVPNDRAASVVEEALAAGYRSIDTAAIYGNEEGVGEAVASAALPRTQLFITTKLWNDRHGYDEAMRAMDESLRRLKLDYVDLYLIHWPVPQRDLYAETWRALAKLKEEGRAKSIGVSNFNIPHLERLLETTGIAPAVNQIELHPRFQQTAVREFHARHGIMTESWSPLGQGTLFEDPTIAELAKKHGKTPAQIILRWHLDSGLIAIPKSATPARIRENFDIFDFRLDGEDMARIASLDANGRIGPDPETLA